MNTQSKVTSLVRDIADGAGLDLVEDMKFANVGRWSFQPRNELRSVVVVDFDFQHGVTVMTSSFVNPARESLPMASTMDDRWVRGWHVASDNGEWDSFLGCLAEVVASAASSES